MITNFETITSDLNEKELQIVPLIIKGFSRYTKSNPIKSPDVIKNLNAYFERENIAFKMTDAKLRKFVNHIRVNSLQPLIASSNGYYCSNDTQEIEKQIQSLLERAASIRECAVGLGKYLVDTNNIERNAC